MDASPDVSVTKPVIAEYLTDARIRYKILGENLGIADNTNKAFEMAKGDYIALFDHDDLLCENTLFEVALAIQERGADVIYTDEDKIKGETGERYQPNFKPDFNLDLLRSNNYICHLLVVKKELLECVGGLRREYDGAQDYDRTCAEGTVPLESACFIHSRQSAQQKICL